MRSGPFLLLYAQEIQLHMRPTVHSRPVPKRPWIEDCIFCAQFCLWDAKFSFQRVPGCNGIADLSFKIVLWTHKFAVETH